MIIYAIKIKIIFIYYNNKLIKSKDELINKTKIRRKVFFPIMYNDIVYSGKEELIHTKNFLLTEENVIIKELSYVVYIDK